MFAVATLAEPKVEDVRCHDAYATHQGQKFFCRLAEQIMSVYRSKNQRQQAGQRPGNNPVGAMTPAAQANA